MTTILPSARSAFDVIGEQMGRGLSQTLPQAAQQRSQRETGLEAINQLQRDIQNSGGDITKMLPAYARAVTLNPNLERSGIGQSLMGFAKAGQLYGPQSQQGQEGGQTQQQPSGPRHTAYNITTPEADDAKAKQDAISTGNPQQYQISMNNSQTKNAIATGYKNNLEAMATREGISPQEMPDFMEVGEQFASQNPDQWLKNTRQAYAPIKSAMDKLQRAFIPGIGSGLIGKNRDEALKRLVPETQDLIKMGREDQARKYLASQYLSPTELEEQVHPLQKKQEINISKLPKGVFPAQKKATYGDVAETFRGRMKQNPFVSYETAKEKAPKAMEAMQNRLSDFFLNNVDENTSLLPLTNKLWEEKDYDWRQFAPALKQAQEKGLKLNPRQSAEMTDISTQPPIQSLPDIFQDWWRTLQFLRGAK